MKNIIFSTKMFKGIFTLILFAAILSGCNKSEEFTETGMLQEPTEAFDGVSQDEEIIDFDIEGVSVIDGVLAFENHDVFIAARHKLTEHNWESVLAWGEKIGFTSLFSEMVRLESLPEAQRRIEVSQGINNRLFRMTDEFGELEFKTHSPINAMVLNAQGIFKIKDHIGTIGFGINIWTVPENRALLVDALITSIINDREQFLIYDDRVFSGKEDWTVHYSDCPKNEYHDFGWTTQFKNPNLKRRIKVNPIYDATVTPGSGGLWNYDCEYWLFSWSYKGKNNRYKTSHYMSIDIDVVPFWGLPQGWVSNRKNTDIDKKRREGDIYNKIQTYRNVTINFLTGNSMQLTRTHPGANNSGLKGTAASHRGMGGKYVRIQCD